MNILGIDISKHKFDVALHLNNKFLTHKFDNSLDGFSLLLGWLRSLHVDQVRAIMEATGRYGDSLAYFLHGHGHAVSIVNPMQIHSFAKSKLQRHKTDKADARLIAEFGLTQKTALWAPPPPEFAELQALTRRLDSLHQLKNMEISRLEALPAKSQAWQSVSRMIGSLDKEIRLVEQLIKDHIDRNPDLKEQKELLESIPGIGERTASFLLSEIRFSDFESGRQVAVQAGLTPNNKESGTMTFRTRISKIGNARIRKGLYWPAIVARNHNPVLKAFADRLQANGKHKMQILCAVMRKMLHIAFGVIKSGLPFDSKHVSLTKTS